MQASAKPTSASLRLALLASFASALAALCYQSLWLRAFGLAFGGSTASLSLVLAIFMGGLALGSAWARRLKVGQVWRAYALAEVGLGLLGLLAQVLLKFLPLALAASRPGTELGPEADFLLKAVLAGFLVLPAAACAGLSLPLLLEALEREGLTGSGTFGSLYAANALGAACGALLTPLFLLPRFGMIGAAAAAASVNLGLAFLAARRSDPAPLRSPEPSATALPAPALFALAAALSGLLAMLLELLWTRSLALLIGNSVYAFAQMLAATLLGLALGAVAYGRLLSKLRRPAHALALGYLGLALAILGGAWVLGRIPEALFALMRRSAPSFATYQSFGFLLALAALLPCTVLLGALFPLLLRLARGEGARRDAASLYLFNTLGCLAGALLGGFVLLPRLGLQPNYSLAAGAAGALAALLWPSPPARRALGLAAALGLGLAGALSLKPWNPLVASSGVHHAGIALAAQMPSDTSFRGEVLKGLRLDDYREGAEAVVAVRSDLRTGDRSLLINGKVDASLRGDLLTQTLLAHLPLCLKPEARSALVIGWGSGCTVGSALAHPLETLDCVELEPAVLAVANSFREANTRKWAPASAGPPSWEDPRLHLRLADARQDLLRSARSYDVIISEPSNPWISGVSNLFTLDFYRLARRRLNPGGLFCQWFHYYSLSLDDLRLQLRTFAEAFPKVSLWAVPSKPGERNVSGDLLLLGSEQEPNLEAPSVLARLQEPAVAADLLKADCCGKGETAQKPTPRDRWWFWSLRSLGDSDLRRLAGSGELNTDDRPRLELAAPRGLYRSLRGHAEANQALFEGLESAALELTPPLRSASPAQVLENLGTHYVRRNRFRRAAAVLEQAEKAGARSAQLDLGLGLACLYEGRAEEARPRLARAFAALPADYLAFLRQGGDYLKAASLDSARRIFGMAVDIRPGDADARFGLAVALARLGEREASRVQAREAVRLRPDLEELSRQLETAGPR